MSGLLDDAQGHEEGTQQHHNQIDGTTNTATWNCQHDNQIDGTTNTDRILITKTKVREMTWSRRDGPCTRTRDGTYNNQLVGQYKSTPRDDANKQSRKRTRTRTRENSPRRGQAIQQSNATTRTRTQAIQQSNAMTRTRTHGL